MNWFLVSLLPPALWGVTNYFDKYLVSRFFTTRGIGALLIFTSMTGAVFAFVICLISPSALHQSGFLPWLLLLDGGIYMLAVSPYLSLLRKHDTSLVVPLFQLIPVFSIFLAAITLGEWLQNYQLCGGLMIMAGTIVISLNFGRLRKQRLNFTLLGLMAMSSLFFTINAILFKYFALEIGFLNMTFWELAGIALTGGLLFLLVPCFRQDFLLVWRQNAGRVILLNGANEVINLSAKMAFNFAALLAPIALTWFVDGLQPLFSLVYGVILTLLLPKIIKESISPKTVAQKIIAIVIMLIGIYFLNSSA